MNQPTEPKFIELTELEQMKQKGERVLVVDVRSPEEYAQAHVDGAINIPIEQLASKTDAIDDDAQVVTVCNAGGSRCRRAAETLRHLGFENTLPLRGGTKGWLEAKKSEKR
jgi:rhodanese-related sulfurtransferase